MGRKQYYSWQKCLRELNPKKPLIVDVFWAIKRFNKVLEEIILSQTKSAVNLLSRMDKHEV